MKHSTTKRFRDCYSASPEDIQNLADKSYELLKADPWHASLHFKKLGNLWSARVGIHHRALTMGCCGSGSGRTPSTTSSSGRPNRPMHATAKGGA